MAKNVPSFPVVNIFLIVNQPKYANIILVLYFGFISNVLLDCFLDIFSCLLTLFRLPVVAVGSEINLVMHVSL